MSFLLLVLVLVVSCKVVNSEEEFRNSKLAGKIIKLDYQGRAVYSISIHDSYSKDTLTFSLYISKFIDDNQISIGDSLRKDIGHDVWFYKRKAESFEILNLYYY